MDHRIALLAGVIAVSTSAAVGSERPAKAKPRPATPIRALLVIGGCCHEYKVQKDVLTRGVSERANVIWTVAYDPDTGTTHKNPIYDNPDWAKGYDVVVHDECTSDVKDKDVIAGILKPHKEGVPAVILHCGEHSYRSEEYPNVTPWFEMTGLQSTGHGPQVPIAVTFTDPKNPITKGLSDWTTVNEELYNNSAGKLLDTAKPLARGKQTYKDRNGADVVADAVCAWTNTYNKKTRVFATTLGHNTATVGDPRYLDLVTRGLLWSVDKLTRDGKPKAGYGPE